jgi:hypothetical protein
VQACEAAGFSSKVLAVKSMSRKLETAVLPWLRNMTAVDACQSLISQAARKKYEDLDGAIADLERSVRECKDELWLPEAHRNLAGLYFERGDAGHDDYENAREQTRRALEFGKGYEKEDREAFMAVLVKPFIETGKELMEGGNFAEARRQWESYAEIFGTTSFEPLFRVEQVAQGAGRLRDLKDARYQRALACLELGDLTCVREAILPIPPEYEDDLQPFKALTNRVVQMAGEAAEETRAALFALAFDMLDAWHGVDPDSYQIEGVLERALLDLPREERLELLRLTDKCWIPLSVAQALQRRQRPCIDEALLAAECGGTGGEAGQILNDFYLQAANDTLDRTIRTARTIGEKRAALEQVEQELLPRITDEADADRLRARLAEERSRLQQDVARIRKERERAYSGCTELLATIQWNLARERDYEREVADFKRGCCRYLMSDTEDWLRWMRTRPEGRLADEEIENKRKLMRRFCAPGGN